MLLLLLLLLFLYLLLLFLVVVVVVMLFFFSNLSLFILLLDANIWCCSSSADSAVNLSWRIKTAEAAAPILLCYCAGD